MNAVRLSVPTLLMLVAVVGAAAFAAGRSMPSDPGASVAKSTPRAAEPTTEESRDPVPPGHTAPARAGSAPADLPAGHPPIDPAAPSGVDPGAGARPTDIRGPEAALTWKAPPRWQLVPSASAMRIATYRIPRASGDGADPELSIIRAGGTVDANADRWVGQFDAAAQKTAKRSTRKVGNLDVTIVEVKGTYSGGMTQEPTPSSDWALVGAIVSTPETPHFFKLTGPAKSVAAARGEFDALVASLAPR